MKRAPAKKKPAGPVTWSKEDRQSFVSKLFGLPDAKIADRLKASGHPVRTMDSLRRLVNADKRELLEQWKADSSKLAKGDRGDRRALLARLETIYEVSLDEATSTEARTVSTTTYKKKSENTGKSKNGSSFVTETLSDKAGRAQWARLGLDAAKFMGVVQGVIDKDGVSIDPPAAGDSASAKNTRKPTVVMGSGKPFADLVEANVKRGNVH